jgi:hypothetical protein
MFEKGVNMKFLLRVFYESLKEDNLSFNINYNSSDQNNRNTSSISLVAKNDDNKNISGPLKPMSPISNKTSNKIDLTKPVVPPIDTSNDGNKNDTIVDLKDDYNKWFYGGLSSIQIFNLVKEAKASTSKLALLKNL